MFRGLYIPCLLLPLSSFVCILVAVVRPVTCHRWVLWESEILKISDASEVDCLLVASQAADALQNCLVMMVVIDE